MFPVIELIDRYAIAKLKYGKTNGANYQEYNFYSTAVEKFQWELIDKEFEKLYNIHIAIWNLEAELKSGNESNLSLEEIGSRAIQIRNLNNTRIDIKNTIADILHCSVKEIKKDHLSE